MPKIKGEIIHSIVFSPKIAETLNLTKTDIINIAIHFLECALYLHQKGILIGDINPQNILVDIDDRSIGLIDTDSFQIGPFKCKVGTPEFTRPELLRKQVNFNQYTRQPIDEAFAIAVLIFRILMLGKHPFSYKGGEDIIQNMKDGNFPYKLKENPDHIAETPTGEWKFIWSHIHPTVREFLGKILLADSEIEQNLNTFDELVFFDKSLIKKLEIYKQCIENGYSTNELRPRYYYIPPDIEKIEVTCEQCGYRFYFAKDYYQQLVEKNKQILCGQHSQQKKLQREVFQMQIDLSRSIPKKAVTKPITYQSSKQHKKTGTTTQNTFIQILEKLFEILQKP